MGDDRIVISSGVAITPESMVNRSFASAFRGYDHGEVRAFLKRAADELTAALAREAELRQALQDALERAAHPQLDEGMLTAALGEHAARLLTSSREAAASTMSEAETRAARIIGEAESKIARVRAEADSLLARRAEESERLTAGLRQAAEADARAVRERARAEAEAGVESARVQGREMVQEARSVRERMLADLSRRRHGAEAQIEQLRQARERLLEAYNVVRRTTDEATAELNAADLGTRMPAPLDAPAGRPPGLEAGGARPEEPEQAAEDPAHATPVFAPREPGPAPEPGSSSSPASAPPTAADAPADPPAPAESPRPAVDHRPSPAPSPSPVPSPRPSESRVTASGPQPIITARSAAETVTPVDDLARARAASASTGNGTPSSAGAAPESRSGPATVTPLPTRPAPQPSRSTPSSSPSRAVASGLGATSPPPSAAPSAAELYKLPPSARVGELFAQMRAAQDTTATTDTTATEVPAGSGSGTATAGAGDADASSGVADARPGADPSSGADDEASEAALTSRDQLLDPVEVALARALKRVLQDEQNEVLDRLRRHRRPSKGSLPDLAAQTERYQAAVVGPLRQAAEAGARMAGTGDGATAFSPGGRDVERWAADLAVELLAPLRERLEGVLDDGAPGGGPADAKGGDDPQQVDASVAERLGAIYRQWKSERVEQVVRHHAHTALCRGLFAASPDGAAFRWVVDDDGPCPDCDDNALAGPVPKGRPFPTGQPHPPAHIGCRCLVLADPS